MRTHRLTLTLMLTMSLLTAMACGDTTETPSPDPDDNGEAGELLTSDVPRNLTPSVSDEDLDTVVAGNTAFAVDLYHQLRGESGNLFYSPHSISVALAMTYGGARGTTADQMAEVMHYELGQEGTHEAYNALDLVLASRGQAPVEDGDPFQLNIVNALWGQVDYEFLPAYLDMLSLNYGAGLRLLDFIADPELCRETINTWVEDQTEDRIKDLLPPGSITGATRLVLTNAIYFNASWDSPFEEGATNLGTFNPEGGAPVSVDMMRQSGGFGYDEGEGYQAVEMLYKGHELSMVIVAPDAGTFADFEAGLTGEALSDIVERISPAAVDLTMPKFEFEDDTSLTQVLQDMGMTEAFSGGADLSGINGVGGLQITDVLHKAFVAVDEAGTEAAAATAVVVGETSVPEFHELALDRPFIFLIRDIETGTVLFLGRILDPTL